MHTLELSAGIVENRLVNKERKERRRGSPLVYLPGINVVQKGN